MNTRKLKLCALVLLSSVLTVLKAQEAIPATGGDATGSGGSSSYSVGQVVYTTYSGTTGSVAHGVQQPFEISTITAIEDAKGIGLSVNAFPNPATSTLILRVDDYDISNLSFQLMDIQGRLLRIEKITGRETSIDMGGFVPATYVVKVLDNTEEIKSIKIIKK